MDQTTAKQLLGLADDFAQEELNDRFNREKQRLTKLQEAAATSGAKQDVATALSRLESAYDVLWRTLLGDSPTRPATPPPPSDDAPGPKPTAKSKKRRVVLVIAAGFILLPPLATWWLIHSETKLGWQVRDQLERRGVPMPLEERDIVYGDRILAQAEENLAELQNDLIRAGSWTGFVLQDDRWADASANSLAFIEFLEPYKTPKLAAAIADLQAFAAQCEAAREAWDDAKNTRSLALIKPLQVGVGNIRRSLELDAQQAKDEEIPLEALQAFVADHHPIDSRTWIKLSWYCPPAPEGPAYIGDTTRLETAILAEAEDLLFLGHPRVLSLLEARVQSLANRPHPGLAQPQRFARLQEDVKNFSASLEQNASLQASALTSWLRETQQTAQEQYPPAMQSFWGDFVIVGEVGRQSLRDRDSGENVLVDQAAIFGVQPPIVLGRGEPLGPFKLWNLRGEELATFTGPVSLVTGRDTDNHFVFGDPARRDRRYLYVPDKGLLVRLAPRGDAKVDDPIHVLVIDGHGNVLQQSEGYWRF